MLADSSHTAFVAARRVATAIALSCVSAAAPGCGSEDAHALPPGAVRARELDGLVRALNERYLALPLGTPEQLAANTRIRSRLTALRVIFRSKERAGLGTIAEERYDSVRDEIDALSELIDEYPE